MIETEGVRNDAMTTDAAIGRLDASDAAQCGGAPYRTACVGAERGRRKTGRHRSGGTGLRSAGKVRRVPGIARRRPRQIERRPTARKLVRRELSEQYSTCIVQAL